MIVLILWRKKKIILNIKDYIEKQKDFYFLHVEDSPEKSLEQNENNEPDFGVLKNLKLEVNERKAGMIKSNQDTYNSTFIISYDLFKNAEFINNEIKNLINDIKTNKDKYIWINDTNLNQLNEDIDKFSQQFNCI